MTRGEIFMLDFGIPFGSEPGYTRPVIIIQAEKENLQNLNTTVVIPLTSNTLRAEYRGERFNPKIRLRSYERLCCFDSPYYRC